MLQDMCSRFKSKQDKFSTKEGHWSFDQHSEGLKNGLKNWTFPTVKTPKTLPKNIPLYRNNFSFWHQYNKKDSIELDYLISPDLKKKIETLFAEDEKKAKKTTNAKGCPPIKQLTNSYGELQQKHLDLSSKKVDEEKIEEDDNFDMSFFVTRNAIAAVPYVSLMKKIEVQKVRMRPDLHIQQTNETSESNMDSSDAESEKEEKCVDFPATEKVTNEPESKNRNTFDINETKILAENNDDYLMKELPSYHPKVKAKNPHKFRRNKVTKKSSRSKANKKSVETKAEIEDVQDSVITRLFRDYSLSIFKKNNPDFQLFDDMEVLQNLHSHKETE